MLTTSTFFNFIRMMAYAMERLSASAASMIVSRSEKVIGFMLEKSEDSHLLRLQKTGSPKAARSVYMRAFQHHGNFGT